MARIDTHAEQKETTQAYRYGKLPLSLHRPPSRQDTCDEFP